MLSNPAQKYARFDAIQLADRTWPNAKIEHAPRWSSTDLRDGNQSLANPMGHERKFKFFQLLLACGFKEIEVAFPSASDTDFDFVRFLIEKNHIPDDVNIQVITQARQDLIERSFESLIGVKQATIHLYNATAEVFRRIVFKMSKAEVIELAVNATRQIRQQCEQYPNTAWTFEYSPETFCFTESEFALEVCEAVAAVWEPCAARPMIINLPTTVEVCTPNVFADQVEWFCRHFSQRDQVCISVHPHNDRGTGVASAELALLAGADRIEGCLFGNGERTGNVDLVNLALNMYSQGISPRLDFSQIQEIVDVVSACNELPIHPRHPYAGELVFTAFSGSHQDAIKKGFEARQNQTHQRWEVPYLPIDPSDVGCSYEAVIRVNSQSGKSGAAWILQQNHGIELPPALQRDFSQVVQKVSDASSQELSQSQIWQLFCQHYCVSQQQLHLTQYSVEQLGVSQTQVQLQVQQAKRQISCIGQGNGVLSASLNALSELSALQLQIIDYKEHSLGKASHSRSISYVQLQDQSGRQHWGVAIDHDIARASIQALMNGLIPYIPKLIP
ncbi:2-isopropylmalate synthase [Acinetobacter calcoaceticus]|uniref:2-isopropylmalate synthase n=1 Tax=Acinetobacter calcoaceticus TaxID=471 RepID=A0A4R1Y116_ACICA|nr:2-isopropylmalate synthase [Acinetobacter calcoaceticus]